MNIGIIGAGSWGSALAILTAKSQNNIILWSHNGDITKFKNVNIPDNIKITKNMSDMANCAVLLVVTPGLYFRETIQKFRDFYKNQPIIICTKGIEKDSHKFMSEILNQELPACDDYGILSGPQFASEVVHGVPTGSTLAGNKNVINIGKLIFTNLYLEETDDIIGAEICGVGKNAAALIAGFLSVTAAGENEKALLLTRTWNEIIDFGIMNNANLRTFMGLCGLGDLFLSATSVTSRNYSAGVSIAKNTKIDNETTEGIYAIKGIIARAKQINAKIPVITEIFKKMAL